MPFLPKVKASLAIGIPRFASEFQKYISPSPDSESKSQSKIRIAAAITVIHLPCLSPTPLWVMFVVRTILLEMR